MTRIAKPFLKWAGGKNQLLEQFKNYYPTDLKNGIIKNYVEPFLGGGAVFFDIAQRFNIERAYLSDINKDLILTYQVIQQQPDDLLEYLAHYQKRYDQTEQEQRNELFLTMRTQFNEQRFEIDYQKLSDHSVLRATLFIALNKTCFNGLFRLNSKGAFNVPYGKYKTAMILDEANILAVSLLLQRVKIVSAEYTDCWNQVNDQSFVYFDPPYRPVSQTANFTTYTGFEFKDQEQLQLALFFKKLDQEKGAKLMLSNSDPTFNNPHDNFFEQAYSGYNIFKVSANRAINCDGNKRGKITELLITNFPT
jgi:DNA adenine methylase